MKKTLLLPLALAAATVAVLAGCTSSDDKTAPTTSPTSTTSADSEKILEHRNTCVDGKATITKSVTLEKSCDEVAILASDITVTLGGTVTTLYIEGDGNTVTAETIGTLNAAGTKSNAITYTGAEPDVTDAGAGNSISKK